MWLLNIITLIGTIAFIYFKFPPRIETVNLEHNIYFGISKIGEWWQIYYYPLYSLVIFIINLILSVAFYKKQPTASHVLSSLTLLAQAIVGVQIFIIMLLNVSQ